ncbi:VQ motif-containing protein 22 [Carica papaya]|uniref:VQ motif-containing protein 22 n=1 Tax=Carica papaya TaxID=3649 RepID=UPI000B8CB059|nr:VQ motif-containing protein 22 [Carica papaya]
MNNDMRSFQFHDHNQQRSDDPMVAGSFPLRFSMDAQVSDSNLQVSSQTGQTPSKPSRRSRSRVSKKTPTTLLNADATNFRALVQHFTGCPVHRRTGPVNLSFGSAAPLSSSSSSSSSMAAATSYHQHQHQSLYDIHHDRQQQNHVISSTGQAVISSSSALPTDVNMENFEGFFSDDVPLTRYY